MVDAASKSSESVGIAINTKIGPSVSQPCQEEKVPSTCKRHEELESEIVSAAKTLLDPTEYFTDTSEVEDLIDSSGVGGPVFSPNKKTPTIGHVPAQNEETNSANEFSQGSQGPSQEQTPGSRRLSASGRVLLRKFFIEIDPIELPRGHPTIALTEGQIRTVLKTISDETILSSFHLLKSLLLQATSGKVLTKERCRHVSQTSRSPKGHFSSSGDESTDVDSAKEGYTRGDFNTDEEPGSLSICLETGEETKQYGASDFNWSSNGCGRL